jgi:hypothetical protein
VVLVLVLVLVLMLVVRVRVLVLVVLVVMLVVVVMLLLVLVMVLLVLVVLVVVLLGRSRAAVLGVSPISTVVCDHHPAWCNWRPYRRYTACTYHATRTHCIEMSRSRACLRPYARPRAK